MGFSRQEYWSELPFPSPGSLSHPGIEPKPLMSSALALAGRFFTLAPSGKPKELLVHSRFKFLFWESFWNFFFYVLIHSWLNPEMQNQQIRGQQ